MNRAKAGILVLLLLGAGCGYQQGSLFPRNIQTVAVPAFQNNTFERGLEVALSKAVIARIEGHSPYKVVPRSRADAVLEGEITEATYRTAVRDFKTDLPREQALHVTVDFVLKDLRTGQILCERRNYQQQTMYYPPLGEGQFVAAQRVAERLALGIVQELEADW
jgi:hypothetical protein